VRVNQDKELTVYYSFSRNITGSKDLLEGYRTDIDELIANYNLPAGVAIEVVHEEDELGDFRFLIVAAFPAYLHDPGHGIRVGHHPLVMLFSIPWPLSARCSR